ncbi:MAG: tetratricopeptide repeat protein [Filimonas sp.]|nr:tetratricopeptide repeat protein [Filimonas sp.]
MRKYILTAFFISLSCSCFCQSVEEKLNELNAVMEKAPVFDKDKLHAIEKLRTELKQSDPANLLTQYNYSILLYNQYKVFKYDSAYVYARKSLDIAYQLGDAQKIASAKILLSFTLLSSGMFKETADSLQNMRITALPDSLVAEYYALRARYLYDLADYANDAFHTGSYNKQAANYLDTAIAHYLPNSFAAIYYTGLKNIRSGSKEEAMHYFNILLGQGGLTDHELAVTESTLSDIYIQRGNTDSAIYLLASAAIADIRSSTKETAAMFNLAQLLYRRGDVKHASRYIEYAINDAGFYGARQRKVQVSAILPLIEAEKINRVESQKKILITYSILITVLLVAVVFLTIVVYRQVRKLKHAQKVIYEAHLKEQHVNQQLAETNAMLSEVNSKLTEANKIKEEYIGYFFNANSEFFSRIEKFKRSVELKVSERKLDEIKFLVNNINLRREKEDLLKNFDKAFLKLFPHFVEEFNLLFQEEDKVILKDDELLNTDLRIFALIRMGIHDNEKIAQILEYSLNTINTYKTKIKNKSLVPNEEFEHRIMAIRTL